jgi:hypothetical protein
MKYFLIAAIFAVTSCSIKPTVYISPLQLEYTEHAQLVFAKLNETGAVPYGRACDMAKGMYLYARRNPEDVLISPALSIIKVHVLCIKAVGERKILKSNIKLDKTIIFDNPPRRR